MNTNNGNKIIGSYIIDLNKRLGKGAYGEVYLGKHKDTQKLVAIKMMPSQKDGQSREIFKKEVSIMQQLNHPNLVKFLAHYETVNNMYVIMEYCDGGTLNEYIQKQCKQARLKYLAESEARIILKQIISGYKEMYDKNIVHRDLKPANILIHRGVVKITDFGFGKIIHNYENDILKTFAGSPLYMSPQILYNNKQYTTKTDIWSLGIIFFEILFGSPPWNVQTMEQLMLCVKQKNLVFPKSPLVSQEMKDIVSKMIEFDEKDRMGWEELFKLQSFFDQKNVDFITQSIIKIKNEPDLLKKTFLKKNLLMNNFVQNFQQGQQQQQEIKKQDKEILKQQDNSTSPERVSNASTSTQSQNVGKEKIFEQRKQSVSPSRMTLSPNKTQSKFSEVEGDNYEDLMNKNIIYEIQDWILHKRNKAQVLNFMTLQMFELLSEGKLIRDKDMYNVVCFVTSKYQLLILYKTLTRLLKKSIDGTTKRYNEEQWKIFCKSQNYKNAFEMIQNEYSVIKYFVKELISVTEKSINNLNIPQFQDAMKVCNLSFQQKKEFDSIFDQIISFYFSLTKQTVKLENLTMEQLQFIYNLKNCMNVHKIFKFKKVDYFKYNDDMKNYTKDQLITKILE